MDRSEINSVEDITKWVKANAADNEEGRMAVVRWEAMRDLMLTVFDKFAEICDDEEVRLKVKTGIVELHLIDGTTAMAWRLEIETTNLGEYNDSIGFFFKLDGNNRIIKADARPEGMEPAGKLDIN